MATIKHADIENLPAVINVWGNTVAKLFSKQMAVTFQEYLKESALEWYNRYHPSAESLKKYMKEKSYEKWTNSKKASKKKKQNPEMYKRTYQLATRAILYEKINDFEYKVSFSPEHIKSKRWEYNRNGLKEYYSYWIMGSYQNLNDEENAADVLYWEENHLGVFQRYGYKAGNGIFGSALKRFIRNIDKIDIKTKSDPHFVTTKVVTLEYGNLGKGVYYNSKEIISDYTRNIPEHMVKELISKYKEALRMNLMIKYREYFNQHF